MLSCSDLLAAPAVWASGLRWDAACKVLRLAVSVGADPEALGSARRTQREGTGHARTPLCKAPSRMLGALAGLYWGVPDGIS